MYTISNSNVFLLTNRVWQNRTWSSDTFHTIDREPVCRTKAIEPEQISWETWWNWSRTAPKATVWHNTTAKFGCNCWWCVKLHVLYLLEFICRTRHVVVFRLNTVFTAEQRKVHHGRTRWCKRSDRRVPEHSGYELELQVEYSVRPPTKNVKCARLETSKLTPALINFGGKYMQGLLQRLSLR